MAISPDPSRSALPARPQREASCPEHGAYTSVNVIGGVWSRCPACESAARKREEDAAVLERLKAQEVHHRAMLDAARIPARFERCSFDNFVVTTDDQRHALTVCRDFVENFDEHARRGAVLILSGKPGTGKSHLAGAILRELIYREVRYTTCLDMIRAIRQTWRRDARHSEPELLAYFERLDLLVIDEVGMQYGTDGEQTIVFDVLDRRYRELKPTILLTNQGKEGFRAHMGERTYDRLRETSRWVTFNWPSYRPTARKEAA